VGSHQTDGTLATPQVFAAIVPRCLRKLTSHALSFYFDLPPLLLTLDVKQNELVFLSCKIVHLQK
jgi:hypothetical protein